MPTPRLTEVFRIHEAEGTNDYNEIKKDVEAEDDQTLRGLKMQALQVAEEMITDDFAHEEMIEGFVKIIWDGLKKIAKTNNVGDIRSQAIDLKRRIDVFPSFRKELDGKEFYVVNTENIPDLQGRPTRGAGGEHLGNKHLDYQILDKRPRNLISLKYTTWYQGIGLHHPGYHYTFVTKEDPGETIDVPVVYQAWPEPQVEKIVPVKVVKKLKVPAEAFKYVKASLDELVKGAPAKKILNVAKKFRELLYKGHKSGEMIPQAEMIKIYAQAMKDVGKEGPVNPGSLRSALMSMKAEHEMDTNNNVRGRDQHIGYWPSMSKNQRWKLP